MLKLSFCSLSEWVHDARNRKKQRPHQKEKKFLPINRSPGYFMGSYEENFSCFKAYTYTRDSAADQKHTMIHCTSHHTCIYIYILSYPIFYPIWYPIYIYTYLCVSFIFISSIYVHMYTYTNTAATVELMTPPDVEGAEVCLAPGTTRHVDARPLWPCRSRSCEKMNTHSCYITVSIQNYTI